jgi:tRNA (cmo5U34)-methyltransferase
VTRVCLDPHFLGYDYLALTFANAHRQRAGLFNAHYVASVPYVLEEQCRLGAALWKYGMKVARMSHKRVNIYTLGDAAGVTARALAQVGNGSIETLTCSPTLENRDQFFALGAPRGSRFFLGPFFSVNPESLGNLFGNAFEARFDVLVEDTTFQMYGPERYEPIVLACRNLRDDGIFVLIEKIRCVDRGEYLRREAQKDNCFKARYFLREQIEEKRSGILQTMSQMEASLEEITDALKRRFAAAVVTWNSGNFYTIAASANTANLLRFVGSLLPPALPAEFCYEPLPLTLFGIDKNSTSFRYPRVQEGP